MWCKMFSHYTDIVIFVLGYFNLAHLVDGAIGQFWKRLASIIAVKVGGHVEHCVQVFNVTVIHCNDSGVVADRYGGNPSPPKTEQNSCRKRNFLSQNLLPKIQNSGLVIPHFG